MQTEAAKLYRRLMRYSQARAKQHRANVMLDSTPDERRRADCWAMAWHRAAVEIMSSDALREVSEHNDRIRA